MEKSLIPPLFVQGIRYLEPTLVHSDEKTAIYLLQGESTSGAKNNGYVGRTCIGTGPVPDDFSKFPRFMEHFRAINDGDEHTKLAYRYFSTVPTIRISIIAVVPASEGRAYEDLFIRTLQTLAPFGLNERYEIDLSKLKRRYFKNAGKEYSETEKKKQHIAPAEFPDTIIFETYLGSITPLQHRTRQWNQYGMEYTTQGDPVQFSAKDFHAWLVDYRHCNRLSFKLPPLTDAGISTYISMYTRSPGYTNYKQVLENTRDMGASEAAKATTARVPVADQFWIFVKRLKVECTLKPLPRPPSPGLDFQEDCISEDTDAGDVADTAGNLQVVRSGGPVPFPAPRQLIEALYYEACGQGPEALESFYKGACEGLWPSGTSPLTPPT